MRKPVLLLAFLSVALLAFQAMAQGEDPSPRGASMSLELTDTIGIDPRITYGKLENGITYYIRTNQKPENRAELRLVVNAGSVLEDENQRGLAHFVEHMGFNGTKNFAKQELVDYLESIGMRFGPDLNAYTSFDETVYMLQVPTDSVELVETAFQILEDWAHQVSFDDEEIDKERGVIIEEWRLGRGAEARMRDEQFPILFQGSRYAERLPIGKKEVVEDCSYETLKKFYRDWYRPDLMAIVAVGDFDPEWIEGLIEEHFSRLPVHKERREREIFPVPRHDETLFAIATDPEATNSRISVYYKHPLDIDVTVADYREDIVRFLYDGMFNQRLYELTKLPDPPFTYGWSSQGRFVRSIDVYYLGAGVKDGGIERGLKTLLIEAARVKEYGFTDTELQREKKEKLRWIEQLYNERDKTESRRHTAEYIRHFLQDEPTPGIAYEYELYKRYLPTITLEEINQLAGLLIRDESRVIMVNAPEKPEVKVPTQDDLLAVFAAAEKEEITAYEDLISDQPLIETPPAPSKIIGEKQLEAIGVTHWTLANGVEVLLKPTDFKNDEVLFTAFSPGGTSLASDEDYMAARTASQIIREGGLGGFSQIALEKLLAGKLVEIHPWISGLEEGLSGNASPQDLETLFQLIYLHFTAPRKDSSTFLAYQSRMKAYLENRSANPEAVFRDTVQVTMAQHHHRARPLTVALLDEMNLHKSFEIYQDRFADASDFTFIFVGALEPDKIKPLVETYLGGLPSLKREETWRDVGIDPPAGVIKKEVTKGLEPKSRVQIIFSGDFAWNGQNRYDINSMATAFRIKLREILREDLGGTYGVGVRASPQHYPDQEYQISIRFGCAPERVEELTATVFTQLDSIRTANLGEIYLTKVREIQRRKREKDLKENRFWLDELEDCLTHQEDPLTILEYGKLVDGLTLEAIRNAARTYFNLENYVTVVLLPEQ